MTPQGGQDMKLQIDITLDSAAFYDDREMPLRGPEIARILRGLANTLDDDPEFKPHSRRLIDENGNITGFYRFTN